MPALHRPPLRRLARRRLPACLPPSPQDRRGDGASGVRTLPVVLGPRAAVGACFALLAASLALTAHAALHGSGLAWAWAARPGLEAPLRAAALALASWNLLQPATAALRVLRAGFAREAVAAAVSHSMASISLGTLLLALLV